MASKYFNLFEFASHQRLYDDLVNQVVKNFGARAYYIPRESESGIDLVFGDDPTKIFTSCYEIDLYIQNVDEFEGGDLYSKFGLQVNKQSRFLITKRMFDQTVPPNYPRPREGDLVWLPNFSTLFEIKYADREHFFYAFGHKFYGYSLSCEFFRYNNEKIETGLHDLDRKIGNVAITYQATMNTMSNYQNTYLEGEHVIQGNSSAIVVYWNQPDGNLLLKNIKGEFLPNNQIIGVTSNARYTMISIQTKNDVNNDLDNNLDIQIEANDILSWDEANPFGEPER